MLDFSIQRFRSRPGSYTDEVRCRFRTALLLVVRDSVTDDVAPLPFPLWLLLFIERFVLLLPVPDDEDEEEEE